MENVLETYAQPYDPRFPVVCMDEQPVQLLKETRVPIAATKHHARRVDYEYERAGTASMFMFAEPLQGWRHVRVRRQRTKVDWALEMEALLRTRYAAAHKVLVVCDNLNTHTMGAFYEAFDAARARQLVRRLEFRYTPKHGSWLNIAENELSALTRQCLHDRRFGDTKQLAAETAAWSSRVTRSSVGSIGNSKSTTHAPNSSPSTLKLKIDRALDVHFINTLPVLVASRHSRESGNPGDEGHGDWMPAFAGMTFYLVTHRDRLVSKDESWTPSGLRRP